MKKLTPYYAIMVVILISAFCGFSAAQEIDKDGNKTATFKVKKGGTLDIEVSYGDITITPWEKGEVFISANGFDEDEMDEIRMKGDNSSVTVKFKMRNSGWGGGSGEFEINIPDDFNVEMSTGGGNISLREDLKGNIRGSSGGGNITLKNVKNGTLDLSTGGGDIRGGSIGGDVELSTGGGNIKIEDVNGNVKSSTGGGNITLGKADGIVSISTGGGNISLNGAGGDVKMSTGGGNVSVKDITGKVKASTGGGNVDLEDIMGSISVSTGGGEITAELKTTGKGESRMSTGGGDIKLYVADNINVTIDAAINITKKWSKSIKKYKIKSDFNAESYKEDEDEEEIRGVYKINNGGERVTLKTSNSNIYILKLK